MQNIVPTSNEKVAYPYSICKREPSIHPVSTPIAKETLITLPPFAPHHHVL